MVNMIIHFLVLLLRVRSLLTVLNRLPYTIASLPYPSIYRIPLLTSLEIRMGSVRAEEGCLAGSKGEVVE